MRAFGQRGYFLAAQARRAPRSLREADFVRLQPRAAARQEGAELAPLFKRGPSCHGAVFSVRAKLPV